MNTKNLIDILEKNKFLSKDEWVFILDNQDEEIACYAHKKARLIADSVYGKDIYIRALIEFTNFCKNDCYYCGIRASNKNAKRYRLNKEEILECCTFAYAKGFRTFVLQGGEDIYFTDEMYIDIIQSIRENYTDCAITLSIGEKTYDSYKKYFDAGADRFLLRHETYNKKHYELLHPQKLSADYRKTCLQNLKKIGYQVGTGFMVGSPYQTSEHVAEDMLFIQDLNPHMVGIGPFIHHKETPFKEEKSGTLEQTLFLLSLIRIMLPKTLLPATTALGTIAENGRELGILAGANVVMPNVSPKDYRKAYSLYDNKISTGAESGEGLDILAHNFENIGYKIVSHRGDSLNIGDNNV